MFEIEVPFRCQSRGDCCRQMPWIVVSEAERDLLPDARYEPHDELGFWCLLGQPCPFLTPANRCEVYAIRPYNCRRFFCGRPAQSPEPWLMRADGSCRNFTARLANARFYRHARDVQAEAQGWALTHGWTP